MEDTFTAIRIELDPATKEVRPLGSVTSTALAEELKALNAAHKSIKTLGAAQKHPPPPVPIDPKRSEVINGLKEQGNTALSKKTNNAQAVTQNAREAIKYYDTAIAAALDRPAWEPSGLVREEACVLYSNRAQAHLVLREFAEASIDAETSIELKAAPGQGKAWWRKVKALMEMGRWDEAGTWCERGLGIEPQGSSADELRSLQTEIQAEIKKRDEARS